MPLLALAFPPLGFAASASGERSSSSSSESRSSDKTSLEATKNALHIIYINMELFGDDWEGAHWAKMKMMKIKMKMMKMKMKMMKMKVMMSMMMMKKVSHDDGYFVMKLIL